jgi:hypothetical protein
MRKIEMGVCIAPEAHIIQYFSVPSEADDEVGVHVSRVWASGVEESAMYW